MSESEAWAFIAGIVVPFVVSYIKRCDWGKKWKFLVALVVSGIAGFGVAYFGNQLVFSWDKSVIDVAIVIMVSQPFYKLFLEDTGLDRLLTGE